MCPGIGGRRDRPSSARTSLLQLSGFKYLLSSIFTIRQYVIEIAHGGFEHTQQLKPPRMPRPRLVPRESSCPLWIGSDSMPPRHFGKSGHFVPGVSRGSKSCLTLNVPCEKSNGP